MRVEIIKMKIPKREYKKDEVGYYLERLREPFRTEAFENVKSQSNTNALKIRTDSIEKAISIAFIWRLTPQGFDYWDDLSRANMKI